MGRLTGEGRFRRAVHLALLGCLAAAPAAFSQGEPFEPPVTTGTRLPAGAIAAALPVSVITREEIDASGRASLPDLLRDISENSFGSYRPQSGSSALGLSAMDLRGLGSQRMLILVDGRRAPRAPFAPTTQDLGAIPLGAVERIEILRDGAAAVYGSGAVGGVVNVILRSQFTGAELTYGRGYADIDGGDTSHGTFLVGLPSEAADVVIGASYHSRDIVFARAYVAAGIDEPGRSEFANNYETPVDGFATFNMVPGGCSSSNEFYVQSGRCYFDFKRTSADEAASDAQALFAKGRFAIGDDWSLHSSASVSRTGGFGRYAPVADVLFVPAAASGIDHDNDGNDDDVHVYHRYAGLGPRDDTWDSQVYELRGEVAGRIRGFDAALGARYNEYRTHTLGENYLLRPVAEQLAAAGAYDFRQPYANSANVLDAMKATISRDAVWDSRESWVSFGGEGIALPGGRSTFRLGADHHSVDFRDRYDSLSQGDAIGGTAGNSSGTGESVRGYTAELGLPLLERLHAGLAARREERSGYTAQSASRASLLYAPLDLLKLRASYGESFVSPSLDVISGLPASTVETVQDQATCTWAGGFWTGSVCTIETRVPMTILSNPELQHEDARHFTAGLVLSPSDAIDVQLDYYDYRLEETIRFVSAGQVVILAAAGQLPPGLAVIRNPAQGNRIVEIIAGYANYSGISTTGLNLDAAARVGLGPAGALRSRLRAGYVLSYRSACTGCEDEVGDLAQPQWRASWSNRWQLGPMSAAWNQVAIAGQAGAGRWWSHDVQLGYEMPRNAGTLAVGALNVTDEMPPGAAYDGRPFNFYLYNGYGRTPYLRYTLEFS